MELLQSIFSLKKQNIIQTVNESGVMQLTLDLIEKHPWNNIIQLKAQQIFEDLFSSTVSNELKGAFVKDSRAKEILMRMSKAPEVKFTSGNSIRNGYMGFVIKLANLIVKN